MHVDAVIRQFVDILCSENCFHLTCICIKYNDSRVSRILATTTNSQESVLDHLTFILISFHKYNDFVVLVFICIYILCMCICDLYIFHTSLSVRIVVHII